MSTPIVILLAILLVCEVATVTLFLRAGWPKPGNKSTVFKCLSSLIFLTSGILAAMMGAGFTTVTIFMVIGFACSLLGDFFLDRLVLDDTKTLPLDKNTKQIFLGITSFFTAHLFYLLAFIRVSGSLGAAKAFATGEIIAVVVFVILAGGASLLMKMDMGKLFIPVAMYAVIIALMTVKAATLGYRLLNHPDYGLSAAICLWAGSLLFVASDMILSFMYFNGKFTKNMRIWNHITYFGGQMLLAYSLFFIA